MNAYPNTLGFLQKIIEFSGSGVAEVTFLNTITIDELLDGGEFVIGVSTAAHPAHPGGISTLQSETEVGNRLFAGIVRQTEPLR